MRFPIHRPHRRITLAAGLALAAGLSPFMVSASGGYGGSGGSSSGDNDTAAYQRGKDVLQRKLACDTCELQQAPRSREQARRLLDRLADGEVGAELSRRDRAAVGDYLQRRW